MSTALAHALNAGLRHSMESDDKVLLIGEDIGELGGVFRVTDGLAQGLRRGPRRHVAARRGRHRRQCHRAGHGRLPAGV